jgi:hypothetical protein
LVARPINRQSRAIACCTPNQPLQLPEVHYEHNSGHTFGGR